MASWAVLNDQEKGKFPIYTQEEEIHIEECNLLFGLEFFCIGNFCLPTKPPHEDFTIVLWNQ